MAKSVERKVLSLLFYYRFVLSVFLMRCICVRATLIAVVAIFGIRWNYLPSDWLERLL